MSLPPKEIPLGAIRFNSDSQKLEYFNGDVWMQVHTFNPNLDGGVRGIFGGGNSPNTPSCADIEYITISTKGNANDFGDFVGNTFAQGGCGSRTRGIFGGGKYPAAHSNRIEYITFSSTGAATDFGGDLTVGRQYVSGLSNSTRGIFAGGQASPDIASDVIDYITMASTGVNAQDFGNLVNTIKYYAMTCASPTRGLICSGSPSHVGNIDLITISTLGNATDFGETTEDHSGGQGCSNSTRGVFGGGYTPGGTIVNIIDYVQIATTGNASDFGDLTSVRRGLAACSSSLRGVWAGGCSPTDVNIIDFVTITSRGSATDFGDLGQTNSGKLRNKAGCSNGHGGLG